MRHWVVDIHLNGVHAQDAAVVDVLFLPGRAADSSLPPQRVVAAFLAQLVVAVVAQRVVVFDR